MAERVTVFAPAKVNLTLHVTGQREDGYHLLDSLVVFADVGDTLELQRAEGFALRVEGPEAAHVPSTADNLVSSAIALTGMHGNVQCTLTKRLPVSSGIGGGSADAAAALRGCLALESAKALSPEDMDPRALNFMPDILRLGADVPMCMMSETARVRGIGERITPERGLPRLHAVLVNPRCAVSTPSVFKAMTRRENPPMQTQVPRFSNGAETVDWVSQQRNDLQDPALALEPAIADVIDALTSSPSCLLARMSGSGATCFGLFENADDARAATLWLRKRYPEWWVAKTVLGGQAAAAMPRFN